MADFYVYVHLTADSKLPFYIGKGQGNRAYSHHARNPWWKSVVKKHGYIAELLHTNLEEDKALSLEMEEIKWFRELGYELVNLTDGGDGCTQSRQTQEKKEAILSFYKENGRLPPSCRDTEKSLSRWLRHYCSPSNSGYSKDFHMEMIKLGYGSRTGLLDIQSATTKQKIRDFVNEHGRFPSGYRDTEAGLSYCLRHFCCSSHGSYCPSFHEEMKSLGYGSRKGINRDPEEKKQRIRDFILRTGKFPSPYKEEEKLLRSQLSSYCSTGSSTYDPDFHEEMKRLGYRTRRREDEVEVPS